MARIETSLLVALVALAGVVRAQPNDDCGSATVIGALPFTDALDVTGATSAFDDPTFDCLDFSDFGGEQLRRRLAGWSGSRW